MIYSRVAAGSVVHSTAHSNSSMEVILELVAHRRNHHLGGVDDLEQRDITRASERDDEFTQERALAGFAAPQPRGSGGAGSSPPSRLPANPNCIQLALQAFHDNIGFDVVTRAAGILE